MLPVREVSRSTKRATALVACVFALAGCVAVFDFDAYDPTRAAAAEPDGSSAREPFAMSVSPTEASGLSGQQIAVKVTIERRESFAEPITLGLSGSEGVTLVTKAIPGGAQELDVTLLLGDLHGSLATTLTATSSAYPGFTATAPLAVVVRGKPGALDTSFADKGVFDTAIVVGAEDVLVLPDDGLVLAATDGAAALPSGSLTLVRIGKSGSLDPTFGASGHATVLPATGSGGVGAECLAPAGGGSTWVAGTRVTAAGDETSLVRVGAGGSADATLGDAGAWPLATTGCRSLEALADGRLVLVGKDNVLRRTSTGAPDLAFGDGGMALEGARELSGAIVAGDGASLVVGGVPTGLATFELSAVGANVATRTYPAAGLQDCVPVRPARLGDGRTLIGGTCEGARAFPDPSPTYAVVAAIGATGALDAAFGSQGLLIDTEETRLAAVLAAGTAFVRVAQRTLAAAPMIVTAHDASGAVTWTFDATGTSLSTASPRAAKLDHQGKVVVVGVRAVGGAPHAFAARFWP